MEHANARAMEEQGHADLGIGSLVARELQLVA
jgi:hypothetical protein